MGFLWPPFDPLGPWRPLETLGPFRPTLDPLGPCRPNPWSLWENRRKKLAGWCAKIRSQNDNKLIGIICRQLPSKKVLAATSSRNYCKAFTIACSLNTPTQVISLFTTGKQTKAQKSWQGQCINWILLNKNQQFPFEQNINKWAKFIESCQKIWVHDFEVLKALLIPTEVADRKLNNDIRVLSPAPHQKAVRCHLRGRRGLPSWHWLWRWAGPPGPPPPSFRLIHAPGYACQNWGSHWASDLLSVCFLLNKEWMLSSG